jgi:hypothetical protein
MHRTLRRPTHVAALGLLAWLVACEGPLGPEGPMGSAGPQGPTGPEGAAGAPWQADYEIVEKEVATDGTLTGLQSLDVLCPSGKVAVGGGFGFSDTRVDIRVSRPYRASISPPPPIPLTGWNVMVVNESGGTISGYVYAACVSGSV